MTAFKQDIREKKLTECKPGYGEGIRRVGDDTPAEMTPFRKNVQLAASVAASTLDGDENGNVQLPTEMWKNNKRKFRRWMRKNGGLPAEERSEFRRLRRLR